jgi:hypothetical protein
VEDGLETIYLIGAGASLPAQLPGIPFFEDVIHSDKKDYYFERSLKAQAKKLVKITNEEFEKPDLESFLTLIVDLEDDRYRKLIEHKYPEVENIAKTELKSIKISTHDYIRKRLECINTDTVEYLAPLLGTSLQGIPLNVFTMNYDGTIELVCEKYNLKYSDGFNPYWDPDTFKDPSTMVRIFKLHGSLYWLKSASRRVIRVPLKGLEMDKVKYFSDDLVSEMMIYPALQKEKYSEIYSWLSHKFILALNDTRCCVIIGYSLRDRDLRENIVDALYSNPNLWLVIISPTASSIKRNFFIDIEISSRIMVIDSGIEETLTNRVLQSKLAKLNEVRQWEENAWINQLRSEQLSFYDWKHIIIKYEEIEHNDRIAYIVERLSKFRFRVVVGYIESLVGKKSLYFLLQYYNSKDLKRCGIWKKILTTYCSLLEYAFFESCEGKNPVTLDQNLVNDARSIHMFDWKPLKDDTELCILVISIVPSQL